MASWPGSLPTQFLMESLSFRRQPQAIAWPTDVGPSITRRRNTAYSEFFTGVMHLTQAQYAALESFYDNTLAGGTLSFDGLPHPISGESVEMKFDLATENHFLAEGFAGTKIVVQMAMEILP